MSVWDSRKSCWGDLDKSWGTRTMKWDSIQLLLQETSRTTSKASKSANGPYVTGWYILSHVEEVKPTKSRHVDNQALHCRQLGTPPCLVTSYYYMSDSADSNSQREEKQCRICLDGSEAEHAMGKLIRPCLCKGSISVCFSHMNVWKLLSWIWPLDAKYVHVKCLQRWRNTSSSRSAFFSCPQCRYQYRFARTKIVGLASNTGDSFILQQIYRRH